MARPDKNPPINKFLLLGYLRDKFFVTEDGSTVYVAVISLQKHLFHVKIRSHSY